MEVTVKQNGCVYRNGKQIGQVYSKQERPFGSRSYRTRWFARTTTGDILGINGILNRGYDTRREAVDVLCGAVTGGG